MAAGRLAMMEQYCAVHCGRGRGDGQRYRFALWCCPSTVQLWPMLPMLPLITTRSAVTTFILSSAQCSHSSPRTVQSPPSYSALPSAPTHHHAQCSHHLHTQLCPVLLSCRASIARLMYSQAHAHMSHLPRRLHFPRGKVHMHVLVKQSVW